MPIMDNLYMERFEWNVLATAAHLPRYCWSYVDDTHTMLKKIHSQKFTNHLKSADDIKCTMEGGGGGGKCYNQGGGCDNQGGVLGYLDSGGV